MNSIKKKLIEEGRLSPDGRNRQALFFNCNTDIPSTPDGMTLGETRQYWKEVWAA